MEALISTIKFSLISWERTADPSSGVEQQNSLLNKLSQMYSRINRISWSIKNLVAPEVPGQLCPEKTNFFSNGYLIATFCLARLAKNFTVSHHPRDIPPPSYNLRNSKKWVVPTATLSPLSLNVGALLSFEWKRAPTSRKIAQRRQQDKHSYMSDIEDGSNQNSPHQHQAWSGSVPGQLSIWTINWELTIIEGLWISLSISHNH